MSLLAQAYRSISEASVTLPDFFFLCDFNQWQESFEEKFYSFPLLGSFVTNHNAKSATLFAQPDQNHWEAKYIRREDGENVLFILRILSGRNVGVSLLARPAVLLGNHLQYRPIQMFHRKELFSSANPLRRLWLELRRFYILSVPLGCLCSLPNRYTGESWGEVNRRDKDSEAQSLFAWCLFEWHTTKLYYHKAARSACGQKSLLPVVSAQPRHSLLIPGLYSWPEDHPR